MKDIGFVVGVYLSNEITMRANLEIILGLFAFTKEE